LSERVDHLPMITPPPTPPKGAVRQQRLNACHWASVNDTHNQRSDYPKETPERA
jgi:hypothetical protein